ncbi:dynamin family protein [Thiolapillus sp.]|uniref:dynamin family protein n=1 Tax=Thiolapillus sp. TaxID=2017437 RepID=UPI0025F3E1B6|nr:dynamin family protein [Thiolapillus sp.]
MADQNIIDNRLKHLETHLEQENPVLLSAVQSFRDLDRVAYRMGLLDQTESFATQIPWWPLISILGTFSAGKSTFINNYLDTKLQRSGNQAVDDRFTVICYSEDPTPHTLPGVSLDSDPRFPFYKISREIELVAAGEGDRIDAYLQLKSCNSKRLKEKILIDSPGFDADAQRTSTLRITDHMVDLSDLVLVFFDARHPEPGAMRDTLEHLVSKTIHRNDSGKFLYILNQIDTTANEDNPEEVIAAWQRALGEHGLTAGRFYTIYSPTASIQIEDATLRQRYESKRDHDLAEIHGRMEQVEVERAYRIVGSLEKTAREIEDRVVPALQEGLARWKKRVLWLDGIVFGLIAALIIGAGLSYGQLGNWWSWIRESTLHSALFLAVVIGGGFALHLALRKLATRSLAGWLREQQDALPVRINLVSAFAKSTRPWRSLLSKKPAGWTRGTRRRLSAIITQADEFVQQLNDRFTNPSGTKAETGVEAPVTEAEATLAETAAVEEAHASDAKTD